MPKTQILDIKTLCERWLANKSVNPETGLKIQPGKAKYNEIEKRCDQYIKQQQQNKANVLKIVSEYGKLNSVSDVQALKQVSKTAYKAIADAKIEDGMALKLIAAHVALGIYKDIHKVAKGSLVQKVNEQIKSCELYISKSLSKYDLTNSQKHFLLLDKGDKLLNKLLSYAASHDQHINLNTTYKKLVLKSETDPTSRPLALKVLNKSLHNALDKLPAQTIIRKQDIISAKQYMSNVDMIMKIWKAAK